MAAIGQLIDAGRWRKIEPLSSAAAIDG